MTSLVQVARPRQWIKNVVVLAGVIFSGRLDDPAFTARALFAFVVFCLLSSGIYVVNDLVDAEADRRHPEKRLRPIASGRVTRAAAVALATALVAGGLLAAFALGPRFGCVGLAYVGLNVLYTAWLKRHVIVDVMCIATGFMLRAIGGVEVLRDLDRSVGLSEWLLLCTFFLALVMAFGKRRAEIVLLEDEAKSHRPSLSDYSVGLLDVIIPLVSGCAILAYSIYTIWPATVAKLGTDKLVYTVPIVVYGFFRYLFLVRERGLGGNPSEILLRDAPLSASVLMWAVAIVGLLYIG
jgi:4-hydroxybenzoate polyprenyltransferase